MFYINSHKIDGFYEWHIIMGHRTEKCTCVHLLDYGGVGTLDAGRISYSFAGEGEDLARIGLKIGPSYS